MVNDRKTKNLISAIILLAGLFMGSLFVDIAQLVRGSGFSEKNLSKNEVIESMGKTWVAFNEPRVAVKVISDETCEKCDPAEALVWFRNRAIPTISAEKLDINSGEAKALIEEFSVKTLPAFIFSDSVTKTDFYSQAKVLFDQKGNQYVLKTQEIGLSPGKYLELPNINENDVVFGKRDSKVKVVIFDDFQCPYCKVLWSTMRDVMNQYQDRVLFDHKNFPLSIHSQAENAALAAQCAFEQEKFLEYGDKLFASQDEWSADSENKKLKQYAAVLGLDTAKFNQCLDGKKYQQKINDDKGEAEKFGISGTPAIFINSQFKNGVVAADDIKSEIDSELAK